LTRTRKIKDSVYHADERLYDDMRETLREVVGGDLHGDLKLLGAEISAIVASEIGELAERDDASYGKLTDLIGDLDRTLQRELSSVHLFILEKSMATTYYAPVNPLFGVDFQTKFTSGGAFELDEAAKCLSLGRPTALCIPSNAPDGDRGGGLPRAA
jgi:hypothetical protein